MPDLQVSSKDVVITGATGFIGQRLASALLHQGYKVRALVRPQKHPDNRLPQGCEQVPAALTDVKKLTEVISGSNAVFYCAGSVRGRNSDDFATANIQGVKALLEALRQSDKSPPMLLLSSLAASRPQLSDYASSKYQGEQVLRGEPLLPWSILRPPAVYGPGDREMLPVLKMIRRGLVAHAGPRDQRLSLLHVDDLVSAMVAWVATWQNCQHQTYAIDDGTPGGYNWVTIGEQVSGRKLPVLKLPDFLLQGSARINLLLSSLLGYAPMLTPGKVCELIQPDWLCDNSDFSEISNWKPRLDLKQGVQQLFKTQSG